MVDYSAEDALVLNHFFTNLDKPIFLTKNLHPEVWALMQARYSRSQKGMREGFLELLKEDPDNFEKLKQILSNTNTEVQMDAAINKAIQFMEKWVLGYGHSSVAEGAVVGVCFEGVSIIASKVIEDNRLASYIEKSTRYVEFDRNSFYIDEVLKDSKFGSDVVNLTNELFDAYQNLSEPVLDYIRKSSPLKAGENEAAWKRATAARRFDSTRYLLPACTKTSIGWTVNARQLAHGISKLLSHPLAEMREIGEATRQEGKKVLPSLLKYADENQYFKNTQTRMEKLTQELVPMETVPPIRPVTLVAGPHNPDEVILSAILYRYSQKSFRELLFDVRAMNYETKQRVFDEFLSGQDQFDWPMRELEHVSFTFDVLMDYGAFRDIQRHRLMTQTNQLLTTFHGFDTPPDIIASGVEVQSQFEKVMKEANELFRRIHPVHPWEAQYIVPLAYRKRVLITANIRELHHFIKLRSTPQGHYSYRLIARQMYELLKSNYPFTSKYLVCHLNDDELGRLQSEQKLEEKISKGLI